MNCYERFLHPRNNAAVAHQVEQQTENLCVAGSSPARGTNKYLMHSLDFVEFYITNVCNLNCPNCNRFNNFAFSGHKSWHEYESIYRRWAEILEVKRQIHILGGEPMLNPEFMSWLHGIASLWPNNYVKIVTNGTQFDRWPELYNTLLQYQGRVYVEISDHDPDNWIKTENFIKKFLQGKITKKSHLFYPNPWRSEYNRVRENDWPDCDTYEQYLALPNTIKTKCKYVYKIASPMHAMQGPDFYVDENHVMMGHVKGWLFFESTLKFDVDRLSFSLHDSDPDKAFSVCPFATCHHFIDGKLYKCGPVGILPEFTKQFRVTMTDKQKMLLDSYKAAEVGWDETELSNFIANINNKQSIPQCAICPEKFNWNQEFRAGTKKHKVIKIKSV